ncbi:MAG TPA: hypothetical protein VGH74_21155, partial [Planctomycetaceae bacterium]
ESAGSLWLRGNASDERIELLLRKIPDAQRFEVLADGQLRPEGKRLPQGRLPQGAWVSLKSLIPVELPVATLAARLTERVSFRCRRVSSMHDANVLLTNLHDWQAYGRNAPQVRLQALTFALSSDNRVVVRGTPLPPIAGDRFYERGGMALACGWGWPRWLDDETARAALNISANDLALVSPAGTWETIPADQFVRATRSAIRLSGEAVANHSTSALM